MADTTDAQPLVTDLSDFRDRRVGRGGSGAAPAEMAWALPEHLLPGLLPTGTVTFLLTDIEGSTRRWEARGDVMAGAVARHYEILGEGVTRHGGVRPIEQGEGDSLVAAFPGASDAAAAAIDIQRALLEEDWPEGADIGVRMALHTGEAQLRDGLYYVGPSIIRCARLRALSHGGQILISAVAADLLADGLPDGVALLPLGVHRLKDATGTGLPVRPSLAAVEVPPAPVDREPAQQPARPAHELRRA